MPDFRADRLATLYLFNPLRRLQTEGTRIPILMYHSVSDSDDGSRHPYYRTVTTPKVFEKQIRFLHENGYRTVSVREVSTRLQTPANAEKLVGITFDDGYEDFYTNAYPILNRYGFSATVFLPTAYISQASGHFNGARCLTWSQVRELSKDGVEFGSHTVTHPQLRCVSAAQMRTEVGRSKDDIEENLGERVDTFSYPYAFPETDAAFVERLHAMLLESEYSSAVTTVIGRAEPSTNHFFVKRLPVNSCDDEPFFNAKLKGGYDWLRAVQYAAKLGTLGRIRAAR